MAHGTLTALFSHARRVAAGAALALALTPSAFALGGDDASSSTKVNHATKSCQAAIATRGVLYVKRAADAMNACLDGLVNCDEQPTAAAALTCRRALLVPSVGLCAEGKVDEGVSMFGNGAAAHASSLPASTAKLLVAMRSYTTALQNVCFTPVGVDLASVATGLGFSPTPGDNLALADAANQSPGGIQCLANDLVLKTHPLANKMTDLLGTLVGTCVRADAPVNLGIGCTVNTDCGPTLGRCGALAKIFKEGTFRNWSIKRCATLPATGQTTCWNSSGTLIPCTFDVNSDGKWHAGAALGYVDNGDGTITDNNTGLMWEKQSDDGSIHDKDNVDNQLQTIAGKIATLNLGSGFAKHTDWRLPNVKELQSIVNLENVRPAVSAAFNTGCVASCAVTTCSCTKWDGYWSSSSYADFPEDAWAVFFDDGGGATRNKLTTLLSIRGVRGGL